MALAGALAILLAASGCGSSSHSSTTARSVAATTRSAGSKIEFPSAKHSGPRRSSIPVTTTASPAKGGLISRYSCRGADVTPELHWTLLPGVAANTKELIVLVRTINRGVFTNWALAGISPRVDRIEAGHVPAGAIVGRNSFGQIGYHLCPKPESFITMGVYAFPYKPNLKPGFSPTELRNYLADPSVPWGSAELYFT